MIRSDRIYHVSRTPSFMMVSGLLLFLLDSYIG